MLVTGELLVAEEEHLVLEEGIVQLGLGLVVEIAELHARDLGTERSVSGATSMRAYCLASWQRPA